MTRILRALGFEEVETEDGLKRTLSAIAARAEAAGPKELRCSPFQGCCIRMSLDAVGQPESIAITLDSPPQPVLPFHIAGEHVSAFSCLDGKPLCPFVFRSSASPELLTLVPVSLFGFVVERSDSAGEPCLEPAGRATRFSGFITSAQTRENKVSGKPVAISSLWAPGLCMTLLGEASPPGAAVGGIADVYANP